MNKGNLIAKLVPGDIVKPKLFFTLFYVLASGSRHHTKCSRLHNVRNCIIYVVSLHLLGSNRGTKRQFPENICSKDDWSSRIFGTFVVKFLACLPVLGFSNIYKKGIIAHF